MQSHAIVAASLPNPVAAVLNLADQNEHRIFDWLQTYYNGCDRLHAIRRGTIPGSDGPVRILWTLGSFRPARKGARVEWSVIYWYIDEIAVRMQRCRNEATARAVYASAVLPDADLPGVRFKKTR